jgi:hypothetical protein
MAVPRVCFGTEDTADGWTGDSLSPAPRAGGCAPTTRQLILNHGDGVRNIADVIFLLRVLFPLGVDASPSCDKALDSNDDGGVHLADAVALLLLLFPSDSPSPELPAPNECGQDPTPDLLDCAASLPAC